MLDEPVPRSGADPGQVHLRHPAQDPTDTGTTVLLVEQDVNHSLRLSDRGYVLEHGRVVLSGDAGQLLENPHIKAAYLGM